MNKYILRAFTLTLIAFLSFLNYNCNKNDIRTESKQPEQSNRNSTQKVGTLNESLIDTNGAGKLNSTTANSSQVNAKERPLSSINKSSGTISTFATGIFGCGSSINDSYYGSGYHRYTGYTLDLSGTPQGSTITMNVTSYDVPNRFTVYDANHYIVAGTNWMGYANYSGPWGMSLNTTENQTITFISRNLTNYSLEVETSVSTTSDAWDASISCAYKPNVVLTAINNASTSDTMLTWFRSLNVNLAELSTELGLSTTLSESDIDFQNLYKTYDSNSPDSGWAISASFKNNSSSHTNNYAFALSTDGLTYAKPVIAKSITNSKIQYFDLEEGLILSINNYNLSSFSFQTSTGNYMTRTTSGCGQAVIDCVINAYSNHGWASVWAFVQTAFIPATSLAITAGCVAKNCIRKR